MWSSLESHFLCPPHFEPVSCQEEPFVTDLMDLCRRISKQGPMRPDFVVVVDVASWLEALRPKGSSGHVCSFSEQLSEVVAENHERHGLS